MSYWGQLGIQNGSSPTGCWLLGLHDTLILLVVLVRTFVFYLILVLILSKKICLNIYEAELVEIIWTVLPALIILAVCVPSLGLLYFIEELGSPSLTVKVMGHQWYWRYEYSDFLDLEFDSYIVDTEDLRMGQHRLLEVDNRVVFPRGVEVRILISRADVIHAWTIPILGIKVDAVPGRLNQVGFLGCRPGIYYGQCSEICGANHSFIPISAEVVNTKTFIQWVNTYRE